MGSTNTGDKTSGLPRQRHVQLQRAGAAHLGTQAGPQAVHRLQDQTIHHFSTYLIRFGRLAIDADQGRAALRTVSQPTTRPPATS